MSLMRCVSFSHVQLSGPPLCVYLISASGHRRRIGAAHGPEEQEKVRGTLMNRTRYVLYEHLRLLLILQWYISDRLPYISSVSPVFLYPLLSSRMCLFYMSTDPFSFPFIMLNQTHLFRSSHPCAPSCLCPFSGERARLVCVLVYYRR